MEVERAAPAPAGPAPIVRAGQIVFRSERARAGVGDLYVMDADGSNVRRLTEGGDFSMPVWAPDGQSIAFRQITALDAAVGLVSAEGGQPVLLSTGEDPQQWAEALGWSAGDLIYTSNGNEMATDLWALSRSGGQRRRFMPEPAMRYEADVSRVHSRIVFGWASSGVPDPRELWVAESPDDPEPERLIDERVYAPSLARWSPDGTRVAFAGYPVLPSGAIEGFTDHGEGEFIVPDTELFVIDVRTGELSRLTDNDEDDVTPSWTPDGAFLIYSSTLDGVDEDIWKLRVDAPEDPVNLIDDDDAPAADAMPNCFWGAATQ